MDDFELFLDNVAPKIQETTKPSNFTQVPEALFNSSLGSVYSGSFCSDNDFDLDRPPRSSEPAGALEAIFQKSLKKRNSEPDLNLAIRFK